MTASSEISAGFVLVEVYGKTDTLKYGTEYAVAEMKSSSVVAIVSAPAFSTPPEPIRITNARCSLGEDQQKSAMVTLTGVKLGGGKTFSVGVRKMEGSTLVGDEIELSGTLSGESSSKTHSLSVVIIGTANPLLSFGTKYQITRFEVDGSISVVDADVTFSVPTEPSRLTSLDDSLQYSSDEKNAMISLSGIGMEGNYNLTLSVNSSLSDNVTLLASFDGDGSGTLTAVLFDSSDPATIDLPYNSRYEVVGVTQETKPVFFESGLVFTTIHVPPRLLSISVGACTVGLDFLEFSFDSVALPSEATFSLTLESVHSDATTPHQKVITLETNPSGQLTLHCAQLYPFETEPEKKKGQLEYDTEFRVVSFTKESTPIHFEDSTTRIQTPIEPARIVRMETRVLNKALTTMIVSLEGRVLLSRTGNVSLTNGTSNWESLSTMVVKSDTHCTAEFAVGREETADQLKYGEEYTLKGSWTESSGFHVEDGIKIVVPFPPMITQMEFVFSNTLHTGCFVILSGTDLIVGESLNVTLNDSLSFIATITSETEAQSTELLIGWPTTLQHNTKYTITSIEATDPEDGKTLFDPAISNTTGSLPDNVVIFVDCGSTSDSTLLCGDRKRPCSWIEDGWKIVEGIGISSLSMSIIHNTTQNSQVRMESDHEVVISSGPSTKPELFVSASSSSLSSEMEVEGMVEVVGGRLWIHQVDVVLSDSPSLIFIRMVGGHLTMETCSLTSTSTSPSNSDTSLCMWSGGGLVLQHATTNITSTHLRHQSQGAINMEGGKLIICTSSFDSNNPHSSSFPSLRHNIRCSEGGEIEIGSLSGGDGNETPSAWISQNDCSLTAKEEISNSPFFIPTLSSSSTSTLNKTSQAFEMTMKGTTLIPCSLYLEVFEKKKDGSEGKMVRIGLSVDSSKSFNETQIEMSLSVASMSGFDKSLEWRGRVVFGQNETTTSFVIQKNSVDRAAQSVKENMKWWIPLLVSLVCLLILIVIVVLVCQHRRKQTNAETNQRNANQEMNDEDETRLELEQKMEEKFVRNSDDCLIKSQQTVNPNLNHPDPQTISVPIVTHEFVEVLGESGREKCLGKRWTKRMRVVRTREEFSRT
ncbi:hypothetical protein BLNAU_16698 [Blattamonas nauphoetae]|uniref:Uncharacterized protein n=1 Tax=Blattamonas nauphoetae TaxID=2049346 RepID=A0ABQ9X853_9EUKA|nr:hypothetical protein BLNAU_16698 [Blattamonas nauphoetae]